MQSESSLTLSTYLIVLQSNHNTQCYIGIVPRNSKKKKKFSSRPRIIPLKDPSEDQSEQCDFSGTRVHTLAETGRCQCHPSKTTTRVETHVNNTLFPGVLLRTIQRARDTQSWRDGRRGFFFLGPAELEVLVTVVDHDGTIPDGNRSLGSAERSVPARGPGWVLWGFSQPSHRILREIISGVQLSVSFQSDGCGAQALALIFANCGE